MVPPVRITGVLASALVLVMGAACVTPPEDDLTSDQSRKIERLRSLGYLGGVVAGPPGRGVVLHETDLAYQGLNLYNAGHAAEATLIDMDGGVLHQWHLSYEEAFPGQAAGGEPPPPNSSHWRRVHLYPNGDLLAIFEGRALIKIDKDSRLLWGAENGAHHEVTVANNGEIYVLTRLAHLAPEINPDEPILEDFITVLAPDGTELSRTSVLRAVLDFEFAGLLRGSRMRGDILHTNTLTLLNAAAGPGSVFGGGNVLTSFRRRDAIAVVDLEAERVVWALDGRTQGQHDPTLLANGHLLIFDNQRSAEQGSRVIEIDPATETIHWQYPESGPGPYSRCCGTAQRLPNGNTLITYTGPGRALEVTLAGKVVWEFENPDRVKITDEIIAQLMEDDDLIAQLMEVRRLPPAFTQSWLRDR